MAPKIRPEADDSTRDLLVKLHRRFDHLENLMTRLDDSVDAIATEVARVADAFNTELEDLRAKLAQAQADDALAAEVAADVEENVARLDQQVAALRAIGGTSEPQPEQPGEGDQPTA